MAVAIMTDEQHFRDVVESDIRGEATREQSAWLREDDNVDHWYWTLVSIKKSVESQLGARKASVLSIEDKSLIPERQREYLSWKARIMRFKNVTEDRLLEARNMRKSGWLREDALLDERNEAFQTLQILRNAIRDHQHAMQDRASDADRKLWSML